MIDFLAGFYGGVAMGWIVSQLFQRRRRVHLIRSHRRHGNLLELPPLPRRGSNPPPPGNPPPPPGNPPPPSDRLIRLDPGRVQRGNGHGGPTTLKPPNSGGYQPRPRPHGGTPPNPPPDSP